MAQGPPECVRSTCSITRMCVCVCASKRPRPLRAHNSNPCTVSTQRQGLEELWTPCVSPRQASAGGGDTLLGLANRINATRQPGGALPPPQACVAPRQRAHSTRAEARAARRPVTHCAAQSRHHAGGGGGPGRPAGQQLFSETCACAAAWAVSVRRIITRHGDHGLRHTRDANKTNNKQPKGEALSWFWRRPGPGPQQELTKQRGASQSSESGATRPRAAPNPRALLCVLGRHQQQVATQPAPTGPQRRRRRGRGQNTQQRLARAIPARQRDGPSQAKPTRGATT